MKKDNFEEAPLNKMEVPTDKIIVDTTEDSWTWIIPLELVGKVPYIVESDEVR